MISRHTFILLKPSSFTSVNMRAIVLLCLLDAALTFPFENWNFSWTAKVTTEASQIEPYVCLANEASCGCCLMQKQLQRMESFFYLNYEELNKKLTKAKMAVNNIRARRSAFSVALQHSDDLTCVGPFNTSRAVIYKHVFLNLGDGYSVNTGIFTAPRSGVYSFAVTIYSASSSTVETCIDLLVNGQGVAALTEKTTQDSEDSATVVVSEKLRAGDRVEVRLASGCHICDHKSVHNTFTGFLLYPTDMVMEG